MYQHYIRKYKKKRWINHNNYDNINNNNDIKNVLECNACVNLPYLVSRIQDSSKATSATMRLSNIYQRQDVRKH